MYIGRYLNDIDYYITDNTAFCPYYPDFDDEHIALAFEGWLYPVIPEYAYIGDFYDIYSFTEEQLIYELLVRESLLSLIDRHSYNLIYYAYSSLSLDSLLSSASIISSVYFYDTTDFYEMMNYLLTSNVSGYSFVVFGENIVTIFNFGLEDIVALPDRLNLLIPLNIFSDLSFSVASLLSSGIGTYSYLSLEDQCFLSFSIKLSDVFSLYSHILSNVNSNAYILDSLFLQDISTFDYFFANRLPLLFFLYLLDRKTPSFSVFDNKDRLVQGNNIFTSADGIYTVNITDSSSQPVLILNPSSVLQSRIKRLDKIYANVPLKEAIIYSDTSYSLQSNSRWITVPRGLRSNSYEIVLYPEGDLEFVEMDIIIERRPK